VLDFAQMFGALLGYHYQLSIILGVQSAKRARADSTVRAARHLTVKLQSCRLELYVEW